MSDSKYAAQQRYNRKNYVRFPLDLRPEVLAAFKEACAKHHTTPTTEIKKFISRYCVENSEDAVSISVTIPAWLNTFAEKQKVNFSQVLTGALSDMYRQSE